jgi:hypothetical protein
MHSLVHSSLWNFRELVVILLISISIDRIAMATNGGQEIPLGATSFFAMEKEAAK